MGERIQPPNVSDLMVKDAECLDADSLDIMAERVEILSDITWCLKEEILGNVKRIGALVRASQTAITPEALVFFKKINRFILCPP